MKRLVVLLALAVALVSATPVNAQSTTNVALGASVSLHGDAFFTDGWGAGLVVPASTVVDGVFQPRGTQWDQGAVWWDQNNGRKGEIVIDLGQSCRIDSLVVQADDNDAYTIRYQSFGGEWKLAWSVPNYDDYGWGMQTRPNPDDDGEVHTLAAPIKARKLSVKAAPNASNDLFFSVSEVQAFGSCLGS